MGSSDSKLKFKSHVFRLTDQRINIPHDSPYWAPFWKRPRSMDDVVSLLTAADIRYIRDNNIQNFCKLIIVVSNRLIYLTSIRNVKLKNFPVIEVLNCVRILTRLLPFLYEKEEYSVLEIDIFWTLNAQGTDLKFNSSSTSLTAVSAENSAFSPDATSLLNLGSAIDQPVKDIYDSKDNDLLKVESTQVTNENKPVGAKLMLIAVNLLFTLNFTVEELNKKLSRDSTLANDTQYLIWEPGVGYSAEYSDPNMEFDLNRLEILRFIMILCSKCMYKEVKDVVCSGSRFLTVLVTSTPKAPLLTLISSLINLACRSTLENSSGSIQNGLDFSIVPFKQIRLLMVTNSLQLLTLMIVYPIPKADIEFLRKLNISLDDNITNLARMYCGKLHRAQELNLLTKGLLNPFLKPFADNQGPLFYLIKSSKLMNSENISIWNIELIMLLWEFYQCNRKFRLFIAEKWGAKLCVSLVYYISAYQTNDKYRTFTRLCVYFLLFLSYDNAIASKLLASFSPLFYNCLPQSFRIPTPPTTYRDFLIIQISNILTSDCPSSLMTTLCEILYNLIPLNSVISDGEDRSSVILENRRISSKDLTKCPPTQISYAASTSIIQLIMKFSSYTFLSKNSINTELLALLLRASCHTICRTPQDATIFLYVISKYHMVLPKLRENIKKLSQHLEDEKIKEERRISDLRQRQLQQIPPATQQQQQQQQLDNESRKSADLVPLSRQNTLESIPSVRNMPVATRQQSQISIGSLASNNSSPGLSGLSLDESVDPFSLTKSTIVEYPELIDESESEESSNQAPIYTGREEMIRPKLPLGMSDKSKSKRPLFATLEQSWPGTHSLNIIIEYVKLINEHTMPVTNSTINGTEFVPEVSVMINKISKLDFSDFISKIYVPDEYNPEKTSFEPLKFVWSHDSLGWYISVLWGCIFMSYKIHESKGFLADISSGFTAIKKVSSSWGFSSWGGSNSSRSSISSASGTDSETEKEKLIQNAEDNVLKIGLWFGTHVELFRVNPAVVGEHYTLGQGKSDFLNNNVQNVSPVITEGFWKRQNNVNSPLIRNGSGVFSEGFWKRQNGRPASLDRRDSDGSLKSLMSNGGGTGGVSNGRNSGVYSR